MTKKEKEKLYSARWYIRERWGEESARQDVLDLLSEVLDPESTAESRPSVSGHGAGLLWCPFARTDFRRARTRGSYKQGYPEGAIVHFTAGRRNGLDAGLNYAVDQGHLYFLIDQDGNIGQNFSLDSWGYHAGRSSYPGLPGTVSNELVGIEIQAAGLLNKTGSRYKTWFNESVPASRVRSIPRKKANQIAGHYEQFTKLQEEALITLLLWLHYNKPEVFKLDLVLGHDEVSPGRKNDPGGALSFTMSGLRKKLRSLSDLG